MVVNAFRPEPTLTRVGNNGIEHGDAPLKDSSVPLYRFVSGFSKDRDAIVGKVPGGFARRYKVHLLIDSLGRIECSEVTRLHAGDLCSGIIAQSAASYLDTGNFAKSDWNRSMETVTKNYCRNSVSASVFRNTSY